MPGTRDPNKKPIQGFYRSENVDALKEYCKKHGNIPVADVLEQALVTKFEELGLKWKFIPDSKFSNRVDRR